MKSKCQCIKPELVFKKYQFEISGPSYRGTCRKCGLLRNWYPGDKYRLIVTGNSQKGGDKE